MKTIQNSKLQKIAADWFRENLTKPNDQVFDIQNDDFFLLNDHRYSGVWIFRAVVYGDLYNVQFSQIHSEKRKVAVVKMKIIKMVNVHSGTIELR